MIIILRLCCIIKLGSPCFWWIFSKRTKKKKVLISPQQRFYCLPHHISHLISSWPFCQTPGKNDPVRDINQTMQFHCSTSSKVFSSWSKGSVFAMVKCLHMPCPSAAFWHCPSPFLPLPYSVLSYSVLLTDTISFLFFLFFNWQKSSGFFILPGGISGKEPACWCSRQKRCGFNSWVS